MIVLLEKMGVASPALIGVILGSVLFLACGSSPWWYVGPLLLIAISIAFLLAGRRLVSSKPRTGLGLIEGWIFVQTGAISIVTALLFKLEAGLPSLMNGNVDAKMVTAAIVAAVTTFLGTLWLDEMKQGSGFFSPGSQFKDAIKKGLGSSDRAPERNTVPFEAIWDPIMQNGIRDWSIRSRWSRAAILARYLENIAKTNEVSDAPLNDLNTDQSRQDKKP